LAHDGQITTTDMVRASRGEASELRCRVSGGERGGK
jgi:hypothetical protein